MGTGDHQHAKAQPRSNETQQRVAVNGPGVQHNQRGTEQAEGQNAPAAADNKKQANRNHQQQGNNAAGQHQPGSGRLRR